MTEATEKCLVTALFAVVLPAAFFALAAVTKMRAIAPPAALITPLDQSISLYPLAVWPYVSWYAAPAVALFADHAKFRRVWVAEAVAFLLCALGYLLLPVTILRPVLAPTLGDLSTAALGALYNLDPPVNLFPSFHAAIAAILVLTLRPASRAARLLLGVWMLTISVACVLTKQHYLVDVAAGWVVGAVATGGAALLAGRPRQSDLRPLLVPLLHNARTVGGSE